MLLHGRVSVGNENGKGDRLLSSYTPELSTLRRLLYNQRRSIALIVDCLRNRIGNHGGAKGGL
jgi:hypothetical protein